MGLFKNKNEVSNAKAAMTEEQAIQIAQKYANADKLYILLSITQANMIDGISVPYIGVMPNGRTLLLVYSSLELAKKYIDTNGYEKLDGIYPIGAIEKEHKYNNIKHICNTALHLGVKCISFNDGIDSSEVFGCEINWFMHVNNMKIEPLSMILSEKEFNKIIEENASSMQPHMNPMSIAEFFNPYNITEERAQEIVMHAFNVEKIEDFMERFNNRESLFENCYVVDYITTQIIPNLKRKIRKERTKYFNVIIGFLSLAIKGKIEMLPDLYTLKDKQSGELIIKDDSIFLIYTDRYKYMGPYDYIKLNGIDDFKNLIKSNKVIRVVVTDGPSYMAILDSEIFF